MDHSLRFGMREGDTYLFHFVESISPGHHGAVSLGYLIRLSASQAARLFRLLPYALTLAPGSLFARQTGRKDRA